MSEAKTAAEGAVKWLMTHSMMRWDRPAHESIEFMKEVAARCLRAAGDIQSSEDEETGAKDQEAADRIIKAAFLSSELPKLLGESLGKHAVIIALIDAPGSVLVLGSSKKGVPHENRNSIMVRKISSLLDASMKPLMQEAGREAEETEPT